MKNEEDEESGSATPLPVDTIEAQINAFASKLGEETENKYTVYIYRYLRNEESGRQERPFLCKMVGIEPDPQQIAEKYRGGKYIITFAWKKGKGDHKTKSYTLDVDPEAFPPLPKNSGGSFVPMIQGGNMSDGMQLQLVMMQTIGEIMKEAYRNNAAPVNQNPLDNFSGILEAVETNYTRMMAIQQKIMERVYQKSMERQYGLTGEGDAGTAAAAAVEGAEDTGIMGKYVPLVKEIVDGLKTVFAFFGDKVPADVVKKVQNNDRFRALIKDPKALVVIGQALRREFGDDKARDVMRSFGVNMVIKPVPEIRRTPDIPGTIASQVAPKAGSAAGPVVRQGSEKAPLKGRAERKRGELVKA